jgi:guanylate kinase
LVNESDHDRPLLVFIGPSGSGKSTAVRALHHRGLIEVTPSWTTRPRRDDEANGTVEHRFVSDDTFSALEGGGGFLEVVRPFDLPYRYGLPRVEDPSGGRVAAIMVRAPLMPLVVRHFPRHLIYQVEDFYDRVKDRVLAADNTNDDAVASLGSRLAGYEDERRLGRELADRAFVNDAAPDVLVSAIADAINKDFRHVGVKDE